MLVAIFHIWWGGEGAPSQNPSAKGVTVPKAPVIRDQQPLSAFRMVATKNLFSQERSNPDADIAKVQNSLEGFELLGTLSFGDTKAAIIGGKPRGAAKARWKPRRFIWERIGMGLNSLKYQMNQLLLRGKTVAKP